MVNGIWHFSYLLTPQSVLHLSNFMMLEFKLSSNFYFLHLIVSSTFIQPDTKQHHTHHIILYHILNFESNNAGCPYIVSTQLNIVAKIFRSSQDLLWDFLKQCGHDVLEGLASNTKECPHLHPLTGLQRTGQSEWRGWVEQGASKRKWLHWSVSNRGWDEGFLKHQFDENRDLF